MRDGNRTSTGIEVGLGTRVSSTQTNHEQGAFETTNNQLDLAIEGDGFFQVQNPNGGFFYTRAGNFGINANGRSGARLGEQRLLARSGHHDSAGSDGHRRHRRRPGAVPHAGFDRLANDRHRFSWPSSSIPTACLKLGDNLYQQTDASGDAQTGNPGQQGFGNIRQGFLEASNVEPVNELIDLITTQRAFELNSQVVQAGDQIMQIVANLRRLG